MRMPLSATPPGTDANKGEPLQLHSSKASFSQTGWAVAAAVDSKPETGWGISGQVGKAHNATF